MFETLLCPDTDLIRIHGRVSDRKTDGVPLFWTGSCVELCVMGRTLYMTYQCTEDEGVGYLRVEVDGFDLFRFPLLPGEHEIPILSQFPADAVKNVRVFRENQASRTVILIKSFRSDGKFVPVPVREHKIEFIGDSITSGEGLACAQNVNVWIPAVFSTRGLYAVRVADALNADYSIVSKSGWGAYCSWDNNVDYNLPRIYPYVSSADLSPLTESLGAADPYSFRDPADVTVVFLGSNDAGAMSKTEPHIDGNGVAHLIHAEDGKPDEDSYRKVFSGWYGMLAAIRKCNPGTYIFLCEKDDNPNGVYTVMRDALAKFRADTGEERTAVVTLPHTDPALRGSRNHPGVKMHELYTRAILGKWNEIFGSGEERA